MLVTRCPVCTTAFRVQRTQLAARGGRVRCGKCGTVFDGIAGLVEDAARPTLSLESAPPVPALEPGQASAAAEKPEPLPAFLAEKAPSVRSTLAWGTAALLAGLVLAGQLVYRYRTEIALIVPGARAVLQAACAPLRCQITLPRRPDLMGIDSSDLQADPRRENVIVLNALLRNRAPFPQEYPALELTLTDEGDRAVLRKVLMPGDYLEPGRAASLAAQGVAAGAEVSVRVYLDAGRARATGYRLYLFYP
jgi:predicted Zn finger-like uncharacterized protein